MTLCLPYTYKPVRYNYIKMLSYHETTFYQQIFSLRINSYTIFIELLRLFAG
jgi:hypothetical protein